MGQPVHTVVIPTGFSAVLQDRIHAGPLANVAFPGGNGAVSAVGAGTPGAGYATIPTVALANVGSGTGATVTALMGVVVNPTITAAGSGGTNGAVTLTGTTGTGTKFQITGTIAGGVLTAITGISVAGSYSAMPSSLTAEPVTGGSLTGCTVNLSAAMGVIGYNVSAGGSNYPLSTVTATVSGGTPATAAVPGAVTVTSAAGAGCTVTLTGLRLPSAGYAVQITPSLDAAAYVSNKTINGFSVTINPRLAASTLGAGTFDVAVLY